MKEFNIIFSGVGGQGVLTVAGIIARAAVLQGYDMKSSELHGLAMRFGALEAHLRLGEKLYSPLVKQGNADLIISLEPVEALRASHYGSEKTTFIFDTKDVIPTKMHLDKKVYPPLEDIIKNLKKVSEKLIPVDASKAAKELTGKVVSANIYLLGKIAAENLLPIKKEMLLQGMADVFSPKLLELNKKVFEAGMKK